MPPWRRAPGGSRARPEARIDSDRLCVSRPASFTTGGSGSRPDLDLAELGADGGDLYDPEEGGGAAGGEGGGGGSKASRSSSPRASSPGAAKVPQLALAGLAAAPAAGVGAGERPEGTEREPGEVHHLPTGEALFSPLTSPKMRKNTFAATLDLIEALCEVSSRLVAAPEEDRQAELEAMLMEINDALDSPEAAGSACLYPLSEVHQQVLRIPPSEAILMNSRERCPYMVFIEVFEEEEAPRPEGAGVAGPGAAGGGGGGPRFNSLFQAVTPPRHPPAADGVNGDHHLPPGEGEEGAAKGTIAAAIESIMAGLRVDDKVSQHREFGRGRGMLCFSGSGRGRGPRARHRLTPFPPVRLQTPPSSSGRGWSAPNAPRRPLRPRPSRPWRPMGRAAPRPRTGCRRCCGTG